MAMPTNPSSYYIHRGLGAPGPGPQPGLHGPGPQTLRTIPNQNPSLHHQNPSPGFQLESSSSPSSMPMSSQGVNVREGEPVKRKRGRPRKYGPDGSVALALSPLSATTPAASGGSGMSAAVSGSATPKRGRGRPPGTGRKQQLASLGEICVNLFICLGI